MPQLLVPTATPMLASPVMQEWYYLRQTEMNAGQLHQKMLYYYFVQQNFHTLRFHTMRALLNFIRSPCIRPKYKAVVDFNILGFLELC